MSAGSCETKGQAAAEFEGGRLFIDHGVKVVCLYGDWEQMGRQWGALGSSSMHKVLEFIESRTQSDPARAESFRQTAELVYSHYPEYLKRYFEGAAETSGLSLGQLKAINAVEWGEASFMCSGIACWGDYAKGGLVYGRNYDAKSYAALGEEVIVTVYHPSGGIQSFATVGYAGEVYCVNGFNESGLFVELNNGMPTCGDSIDFGMSLNTTELMRLVAEARNLDEADAFFASTPGAAGFLIGVSDGDSARCYEWFSNEVRRSDGNPEGLMVMNNHFTHCGWNLHDPAEENCWQSHRRRENLIAFAEENKGKVDARMMGSFLMKLIKDGGPAIEGFQMYQIVAIPSQRMFYLNVPGTDVSWAEIKLEKYFR